jgi:CO dehydrogenase/acetyl-CoA synthase gamma subunit (corrinoid Fe-S protein)
MIARLIAILFLSREIAHRDHLKTTSFSQHMALGSFYDEIVDLADSLTEMYQGRHGIIDKIPMLVAEPSTDPANDLQKQLDAIEKIRYTAVEKTDTAIQNKIDEIVGLYLSTLYKLRNLK